MSSSKSNRKHGAPKNWKDTFIAVLGETSCVKTAIEAADISPTWVYKMRRDDPAFASRWFDALCEGYDNLEMDLLYRLRSGKLEDVDEHGNKSKFDIAAAFRCLVAHRETVSRQKARRSLEDEKTILASINAKIAAMRAREQAAIKLLQHDGVQLIESSGEQ